MRDLSKTCSACVFWTGDKKRADGEGQCRRWPKQAGGMVGRVNMLTQKQEPVVLFTYPQSSAGEWCGEWQPEIVS